MMARIDQVLAGEKTWGAWWLDQLGHAGLGAAWSIPFIGAGLIWLGWGFWFSWGIGLVPALIGGAVRDFYFQWKKSGFDPDKLHPLDRSLDTAFHAFGPPIAWSLASLVIAVT